MEDYNPLFDYVKGTDDFKRDNLRAYLKALPRKELVALLFEESERSEVKLDRYDVATIAALIVDLKLGKEEE